MKRFYLIITILFVWRVGSFGVSMPMSFGILPVVILLNLCPVVVESIG